MICIDNLNRCYYLIIADVMVNYKKQVPITRIKVNMQ